MKTAAIIGEYNPFHKGHKYQMEEARKMGFDKIVVIMSGDFTQRCEPAIIDKYVRAEMALLEGADLVLELPVMYATGDAGVFAEGAVGILDGLGCIDGLVFGVEQDTEDYLWPLADFLADAPEKYYSYIRDYMGQGENLPKSRERALGHFFPEKVCRLLNNSNFILGIEYCRALRKLKSGIQAIPVLRIGDGYNSSVPGNGEYTSARAIRNLLLEESEDFKINDFVYKYMPVKAADIALKYRAGTGFLSSRDFGEVFYYKLLTEQNLSEFYGIEAFFEGRIRHLQKDYRGLEDFCDRVKSKNITRSSVMRLFSHIYLDMRKPMKGNYARILGIRKKSGLQFGYSRIPVTGKVKGFVRSCDNMEIVNSLEADIRAADIYRLVLTNKYGIDFKNDYSRGVVVI